MSFFVYKTQSCYAPLQSICSFPILALSDSFFCRQSELSANRYQLLILLSLPKKPQQLYCSTNPFSAQLAPSGLGPTVHYPFYDRVSTTQGTGRIPGAPQILLFRPEKARSQQESDSLFVRLSFICFVLSTTANCASFWCTIVAFGFGYLYKSDVLFFSLLLRLRYVCTKVVLIQRVDFGSLSL